ncbi:hypothetical protein BH23PLA1_BH23PLA1_37740 [soil metagenome]
MTSPPSPDAAGASNEWWFHVWPGAPRRIRMEGSLAGRDAFNARWGGGHLRDFEPMATTIIPRDQVAQHFSVAEGLLLRYEGRGLVRVHRQGDVEGYEPAEVRRLWTILTFQRDLGINLAGVEAILQLQAQLTDLRHRLDEIAEQLHPSLEDREGPRSHG